MMAFTLSENQGQKGIASHHKIILSLIAQKLFNMKTKFRFLFPLFLMAVVSSCAKKTDIEGLQSQIDDLRNTQIASINSQISTITSSLSTVQETQIKLTGYIGDLNLALTALQSKESGDVETLRSSISALEQKDAELKNLIDNLKTYVDTGIKDSKDWASATFATLEQYVALQGEMSTIKQALSAVQLSISSLDAKLAEEIQKARTDLTVAISASETSMRSWVNDKLTGYYTIAETEAKLAALKSESKEDDEKLQKEIDDLESALAAAREELTQAYQAAISSAIQTNNGVIDGKIAAAISQVQSAINETIAGIESRLSNLESRLAAVEGQISDIIAAVQSVVVVPDYSDGSVKLYKSGTTSIRFEVYPLSAAEQLAEIGVDAFSLDYVETYTKSTALTNIPITGVSYDGEFIVANVDGSGLSGEIKKGYTPINARLRISDGTVTRSSEYFNITCCEPVPVDPYVDLGLSVMWATFNLGASKPEEYGGYYQWGGLEDVSSPDVKLFWDNCPYHTGSDEYMAWSKYVPSGMYSYWSGPGSPDNKTVLDTEDDIAKVTLGDKWRIPTGLEWEELINNCTCTWTRMNGVSGFMVVSRKTGYTDKWIFLPAAGRGGYGGQGEAGTYGNYWSSSLCSDSPYCAQGISFKANYLSRSNSYRYDGISVRPIMEKDKDYQIVPVSTVRKMLLDSTGDFCIIGDETYIEVDVISNRQLNNLESRRIVAQDYSAGLDFYCTNNHTFDFGDVLRVNLSGKKLKYYKGRIEVDGLNLSEITKIGHKDNIEPIVISVDQINLPEYESRYVAINDVQVAEENLGKTWVTKGSYTTINMTCINGMSFVEFSGSYSAYGNQVVPSGSGTIKGWLNRYNDIVELVFSKESDWEGLVGDRFYNGLIDLGLSVKWATCNLGATKPVEYGGYYQWAGTEDVSDISINLDWSNCPYHTESGYWFKYTGYSGGKTVLELEDDVANVTLGGAWRTPTDAEWTELGNNCTWTWTTLDGVNGYKVTSRKSGYTDKWIFLPAAGYRWETNLGGVGDFGHYWSSSLYMDNPGSACGLDYDSYKVHTRYYERYFGRSIRPVSNDAVNVTGVTLNSSTATVEAFGAVQLTATIYPSDATYKGLIWESSAPTVATVDSNGLVMGLSKGEAVIAVRTSDGGFTDSCTITVMEMPEMVDLGLSVKWRGWNVGATKPEESGGYYQWAGLNDVTSLSINLDFDNCPYHTGSDENIGWTKYVSSNNASYWLGDGSPDNKTVLDPEDDVAHATLGSLWRMPTDEEWSELRNSCTWTWVNGVNGFKVQSRVSGYTDKCIFLPAAGFRYDTRLTGVGYDGYYWSSSLNTTRPYCARSLAIRGGSNNMIGRSSGPRYRGFTVRPVAE